MRAVAWRALHQVPSRGYESLQRQRSYQGGDFPGGKSTSRFTRRRLFFSKLCDFGGKLVASIAHRRYLANSPDVSGTRSVC